MKAMLGLSKGNIAMGRAERFLTYSQQSSYLMRSDF